MEARTLAATLLVTVASALAALTGCSSRSTAGDGDPSLGQSQQALRPRGEDPPDPVEPPPTTPHACAAQRIDLYRNSGNACKLPPASSYGTWSMQPLFPNAPAALRDRFCSYTWKAKDTTGTCAGAPNTIEHTTSEKLGYRTCPLSQPGCGTTTVNVYDPAPPPVADWPTFELAYAKTAPTTTTPLESGALQKTTTTTSTTTTTTSSGGTVPPTDGVIPAGSVGCCDACAEIIDDYAFVVLPENTVYDTVYFDAYYQAADGSWATENVTIDNPTTNVIQVNMNPYRTYSSGLIWSIHTTL